MTEHDDLDAYTDPLDFASNITLIANSHAVKEHARKAAPKQQKDANGLWETEECVECGEPIGAERLEATGSDLCIECATALEKKGKQYAK